PFIASLATTQPTLTPPADHDGVFAPKVVAASTEPADKLGIMDDPATGFSLASSTAIDNALGVDGTLFSGLKGFVLATGHDDTLTVGATAHQFLFNPDGNRHADPFIDFTPGENHID